MNTLLKEETLSFIKAVTRGASAEMPEGITNTEKKKMIGYIAEKLEGLKEDSNPKIRENLVELLKQLQSELANKKDEMMLKEFAEGIIPEGFKELSENSKANRLARLRMIAEYRMENAKASDKTDYFRAAEVIGTVQ